MEIRVLAEDPYLIVVEKPVGVLSEEGGLPNMLQSMRGGRRFYTVHRLDRDTGGVMVYAKNGKTAAALSEMFASRQTEKEYLACVHGVPDPACGTMDDLLFHDASRNKTFVVDRMRKGVREAHLEYETIASEAGEEAMSLVRIRLGTGRSHQIRVQFASRKMPLLGDVRYGSRLRGEKPALWAARLAFVHPVTEKTMEFCLLPPAEGLWTPFAGELREELFANPLRNEPTVVQ